MQNILWMAQCINTRIYVNISTAIMTVSLFFAPKEFFLKAANSTTNLTGDHLSLTFLHHQNYT